MNKARESVMRRKIFICSMDTILLDWIRTRCIGSTMYLLCPNLRKQASSCKENSGVVLILLEDWRSRDTVAVALNLYSTYLTM